MFSCSSTRTVYFNITRPAQISLPSDVNTILLVDRTKFKNETLNIIEGLLTGEMPTDDRVAAQEALMSLKNKLDISPRYSVKISPDRLIGGSLNAAFPEALRWNVIDQLCTQNHAEMVVSLEVFDSNFIITKGTRVKKKTVGAGAEKKEVDYTEYYAQGVGNVKMGIRSYYNKDKTIVDQQMITKTNSWEGAGATPMDALRVLIDKAEANKYLARMVGEDYAYKISPMPVRISRPFNSKSKHVPEVASGSRYADVGQWKEAIDEWKKGLLKAEPKEAGKIAYNIAVAHEVLGEYGTALTWAQDAYTKYGNTQARDYVRQLQKRINEENVLKQQMNQ
jgi:tetratricopeptide (TPR) repeat protein